MIAQDPSTAKFDGMPRAAIQTQCADLIIRPQEIGAAVESYIGASLNWVEQAAENEEGQFKRIFSVVRRACGMDLSQYKEATVRRRIARRMGLKNAFSLEQYSELVCNDNEEARQLGRDVIISVTEFFRDEAVFSQMESTLKTLVDRYGPGDVIRLWVAGTATGEEAYSFAMILSHLLSSRQNGPDYLIFASDLDDEGIERARQGVYAESLVGNIPEKYRKYLKKTGANWQVRKSIRQNIVFAVQDIIADPPFSRLDFISCRNVLIYLKKDVQRKVMRTFHYSLNNNGYLLLGKSETAEIESQLFEPIDTSRRLYKKCNVVAEYAPVGKSSSVSWSRDKPAAAVPHKREQSLNRESSLISEVMHALCPPGLVVNAEDCVEHFVGDLSGLLSFPKGRANTDVYEMLPNDLRAEFRAMVNRCRRELRSVGGRSIRLPKSEVPVQFKVQPLRIGNELLVLISFTPVVAHGQAADASELAEDDAAAHVVLRELESELESTRQHLQTVVEELETSNEELQSQSEELQSANEELQSTNEELQTSNEELQSTNEELLTVNDELQLKSAELQAAASTLVSVRESLGFPILVLDTDMRVLQYSQNVNLVAEAAGVGHNTPVTSIHWHTDLGGLVSSIKSVLLTGQPQSLPVVVEPYHFELRIVPNIDQHETLLGVVLEFVDVTARIKAEAETQQALQIAKAQEAHYATTLAGIADSVITVDNNGRLTFMNAQAEAMTGWSASEALGISVDKILQLYDPDTESQALPLLRQTLATGRVVERSGNELLLTASASQKRRTVEETASPLKRDDGQLDGAVLVFRDITNENVRASQLRYKASHDSLTGLLNREEFERQLSATLANVQQDGNEQAVVAFLDLDQFKVVNDTCGHAEGDKLLRQVSLMIKSQLRAEDVVARLGGDEFGILCPGCTERSGRAVFKKLLKAFSEFRFETGEHTFTLGASIGMLSLAPTLPDVSTVLRLIDGACYQAKEEGRNRVNSAVWSDDAELQRTQEAKVAAQLVRALDEDRIELYAQPILDIGAINESPGFYELLLRLRNEQGELMTPLSFMGIAERNNMMPRIDKKVCTKALQIIGQLKDSSKLWAINLSAQSVESPEFLEYLLAEIERNDVDGSRLCFEITETTAIRHMPDAVQFVNALREKGVLFALDDFGSGMSSFGYLNKLKIDFLKLDGSFVSRMTKNKVDFSLVGAMTKVGHDGGMKVVAEHVSNEKILDACERVGADFVQGFYVGKPQPMAALIR